MHDIRYLKGLAAERSLEDDVAPVVEVLPDLQQLNLGYNQLHGQLTCRLLTTDHQLKQLDLAENKVWPPQNSPCCD